MNESMNEKGVCRTAPATPGLLKKYICICICTCICLCICICIYICICICICIYVYKSIVAVEGHMLTHSSSFGEKEPFVDNILSLGVWRMA